MGVRQLPQIAQSLIAAGRLPTEPVAIVERGTLPGQRTVTGTLATIAGLAQAEDVRAPRSPSSARWPSWPTSWPGLRPGRWPG